MEKREDSANSLSDTGGNAADDRTSLLTDASTGARSKTTLISGRATPRHRCSGIPSHLVPNFTVTLKAAQKACKSAFEAAAACDTSIKIAMDAIKEGEKFIDTVLDFGENVHDSHASHYLDIVTECRNAVLNLSERVRLAEQKQQGVESAANNLSKVESKLAAVTVESVYLKVLMLWATNSTKATDENTIHAYKAAYLVLVATRKLWQEIERVIDLESSFKTVQPPKEGTSELTYASMAASFLMGCTLMGCYFYVDIKGNFKYLPFLGGCACITGSVFTGIFQAVRYCTSEENSWGKAKIARAVEDLEERLKKLDEYFALNEITPPPSDSSENEVNFVVPSEIPATQT